MKRLVTGSAIAALFVLTFAPAAPAQITVTMRLKNDTVLLYESIPVVVSIRNFSGRPLALLSPDGRAMLQFLITAETGRIVPAVGQIADEDLVVKVGQTMTREIDLLPLYDVRQTGNYRVRAIVDDDNRRFESNADSFLVLPGREIWSQMVGLPGSAEAGETRLYALVLKRLRENERLYVMVRDPAHQRVLGLLPLGSYLPMEAPEVTTDKAGALHILYRNAPQVFGYACIDGNAKVLETAAYSDAGSAPHFAADDEGAVKVQGGQKVVPGAAPVLVPQPAPPPPKKKKWWWPFGGGSTNQTATAQSPAK